MIIEPNHSIHRREVKSEIGAERCDTEQSSPIFLTIVLNTYMYLQIWINILLLVSLFPIASQKHIIENDEDKYCKKISKQKARDEFMLLRS